jgi:NDP-sugar pyrophosphorylase family protein
MDLVIIPVAGEGLRFKEAGYTVAKPFIEFQGKSFLEHVLLNASECKAPVIIIARDDILRQYSNEIETLEKIYGFSVISISEPTRGAGATATLALSRLKNLGSVLFLDCDTFYKENIISEFIKYSLTTECDGSVLSFGSTDSGFSYVSRGKSGEIAELIEKEVVSCEAISGAYLIRNTRMFLEVGVEELAYDKFGKELYTSRVITQMIKRRNAVFVSQKIVSRDIICCGTPELFILNGGIKK